MCKRICIHYYLIFFIFLSLSVVSCKKETIWKPGMPLAKEKLKIAVIHLNDPFMENSGYSYAHENGIQEMKRNIGLADTQIIHKVNVSDGDLAEIEETIRDCIAQSPNIIIATADGYERVCEKLAGEYPNIIFTQIYGNSHNNSNLTAYFGRVYQARYLSGIVAGLRTRTDKIGFVASWGKGNSQVTSGLNAFALGVEKVNPRARIHVKITHSWFDPMGETLAARTLITEGCDIIAQHCDTHNPQVEAEKAGVWGIGYNTDMKADAPAAVLTSVIWQWGAYYTALAQSVIDGTFTTAPYYGSLKDGVFDLSPLNENIGRDPETGGPSVRRLLEEERLRIESGTFDVFSGIMETNDGRHIGREGENLSIDEIHRGTGWYYRNVVEMK